MSIFDRAAQAPAGGRETAGAGRRCGRDPLHSDSSRLQRRLVPSTRYPVPGKNLPRGRNSIWTLLRTEGNIRGIAGRKYFLRAKGPVGDIEGGKFKSLMENELGVIKNSTEFIRVHCITDYSTISYMEVSSRSIPCQDHFS